MKRSNAKNHRERARSPDDLAGRSTRRNMHGAGDTRSSTRVSTKPSSQLAARSIASSASSPPPARLFRGGDHPSLSWSVHYLFVPLSIVIVH
ncbi:hypothetical protein EYC84_001797 [Monilinia fructicola]|uniref:Uncharacterized protein n=1 Tax=Monilinia fructicola TaxID=38448 RepID=A0A5M9JVL9_MONFR|nr:hypothetical protein EYC84_001797 [Monilinia fructicola]